MRENNLLAVFMASTVPGLVIRPHADFPIAEVNHAYLQVTHTTRDQLVSKTLRDVCYNEDTYREMAASLQSVISEKRPHKITTSHYFFELARKPLNGRPLLLTNMPLVDENGKISFIIHTIENIAETASPAREQADPSVDADLFRIAFEHSESGMALIDLSGRYLKINDTLCQILGYKKAELLNMKFYEVTYPADLAGDLEGIYQLIKGHRKSIHRDKRYFHRDGHVIWASLRISVVRDSRQNPLTFLCQMEDITERKHLEQALKKSEQEYKSLFEQNPDAVFLVDTHGRFLRVNDATVRLFHFSAEEMLKMYYPEFCLSESREKLAGLFSEEKIPYKSNFELSILPGNGKKLLIDVTHMPVMVDGSVTGIYGVARDITVKRKLEKKLRTEKQRFSDLFLNAPVSMCILKGKEHVFVRANSNYYKLVGRTNIIGKKVRDVFPEVEGQGYFEWLDDVYRTGETFSSSETPLRLEINGKLNLFFLNFIYQPYKDSAGKVRGIFFFGVDITEQVLARKKIEEREKKYDQLIQNLPVPVYTCNTDGHILLYNKAAVRLWGWEPETGQSWCGSWKIYSTEGFVIPHDLSPMAQTIKKGAGFSGKDIIIKRPDGSLRDVIPFPIRTYDADGNLTGGINVLMDITERRQAEEKLRRLSLIAKKTVNAVIISNPAREIEWVNKAFTTITGFEYWEVAGKKPEDFLFGEQTDPDTIQMIIGRKKRKESFEYEILKYTKSGKPFWVEGQSQPLFNSTGMITHYFDIETDITEKKNAYEKLVKTENEVRSFAKELNNVLEDERTRIAREIHDEFGQQLTGLKMSLSSLSKIPGIDSTGQETIKDMIRGVESTIESLRTFSTELRPGILDTLGLAPSIEWLAKEFKKKTGINCELTMNVKQHVFEKTFSTAYFRICQEALTNIMKHAEATNVFISLHLLLSNTLTLTITDNGKGIPKKIMDNIFSMGLLGMRERARLIGASLKVISTENGGTTIHVEGKVNG